ncbi:MAG TPA: AraC family transcriptional regulator [Chitinophagaceae bacterium]|nr:AraC family transcriptional regulator [Chitinophagaceae bacterium]
MYQSPDILSLAHKRPVMLDEMQLLTKIEKQIPGSVQYSIKRYRHNPQMVIDDIGMLVYNYQPKSKDNNLELRFCITGNAYCSDKRCEGGICVKTGTNSCSDKVTTIDVLTFTFSSVYLSQFVKGKQIVSSSDKVLAFKHHSSFSKMVNLCNRTRLVLDNLLNHTYSKTLENIYVNSQLQTLLLYGLECLVDEKAEDSFACKFLASEAEREKITKAREILLQHIGEPLTIKELSRKVAINECYLKKGFKEMFGTTVFDFYQGQRMEHAKYLLYEKGLSVTEVSALLGYSSISHFSTAFKKHTGIKPCELLMR